ncbi:MAG TPA: hypothetical protein VFH42_00240 [Sporolactobacillaceae bacterium]|nr:hypothetical protein [Sporolactobacillaceae bacterium]
MKKEAESGWWAFSVAVLMLRDGGEPIETAKEKALKIIDYLYSEKESD